MLRQPAFGRRLRELRAERGMSQAVLAKGIMSTGYLSRLESGARPPTRRVVELLARNLGAPLSAFEATPVSPLASVLTAITASTPEQVGETVADALRGGEDLHPALRWQALWLLARTRGEQGRHAEQHELLTELVALSDELGAPELRVRARAQLSRCAGKLGDYAAARQHALRAHGLAAGTPLADQAGVLHALICAEAEAGQLTEAAEHADELCALTGPAKPSPETNQLLVEALWASATVRLRQGSYPPARQALERALDLLDSHTDLLLWMRLRLAAASLYLQITPPVVDEARARLDDVEPVLELVGTDLHKQQMLALRAHLAFEQGRMEDARRLCELLDRQTLLLAFRDRLRFQALRARLLILDGHVDAGSGALQELAAQAEQAPNAELAAEIWRALARSLATVYGREGGGSAGASTG